jgi:hypothetical protein
MPMNGLETSSGVRDRRTAVATEIQPGDDEVRGERGHADATATAELSSPDPMYPTDRYRLVMPYRDRL